MNLSIADKLALGSLFRDILEGANFVRLDESNHPKVQASLILDLTWPLTEEQADLVRTHLGKP